MVTLDGRVPGFRKARASGMSYTLCVGWEPDLVEAIQAIEADRARVRRHDAALVLLIRT